MDIAALFEGLRSKMRCRSRHALRARSIAGEREREQFNHETAMDYIAAHPLRIAAWEHVNGRKFHRRRV